MNANTIIMTDSYKLSHYQQYPENTTDVYSYFESRVGARFPTTVFFGLQAILKEKLCGRVTYDMLSEAAEISRAHFGGPLFNYKGWGHIIDKHNGYLPLRIKAVPEGTPVPVNNVLMTVENTCPQCFWLTNAVESLLTHVWYPSTVASLSRSCKVMMCDYLLKSADTLDALPFMLHDFGYRGATTDDAAAIGGAAHLLNFMGTDTLVAMKLAHDLYGASYEGLAYSVPATEHSVMTALGEGGEYAQVERAMSKYPTGILSVVGDSYDYHRFVRKVGTTYRAQIVARDGKFVTRPDSCTDRYQTPAGLSLWTVEQLYAYFGGHVNSKGYKVLDPHVGALWGDGIDKDGIDKILSALVRKGFSAENMVFGMGGGLLQKVNRDTQRFAFKSSAQKRDGEWHDVFKKPLDESKASKKGRLRLALRESGELVTLGEKEVPAFDQHKFNVLQTVYEDGKLVKEYTFDEIRQNAALATPVAYQ